jgi:hypothetical protein
MSAPVVVEIETLAGEVVARLQGAHFVPRRDVVLAAAAALRVEPVRVWLEEEDPAHVYSASAVVMTAAIPYFTNAKDALGALVSRNYSAPVASFSDDKGRLYFPHAVGTLFKNVESYTPTTRYFLPHLGDVIRSVRVDVPFNFYISGVVAWRSREREDGMHEICFPHGFPLVMAHFHTVNLVSTRNQQRAEIVVEFLNKPDRVHFARSKFVMSDYYGKILKCSRRGIHY